MIDIGKLRQVMLELTREKGDFTLFGLFLREEAPDKWDLVVSAPWLEEGKLKALGELTKRLSSVIGEQEVLSLSRIVTVNRENPVLNAILAAIQVDNGLVVIQNSYFSGIEIKEAHILRAKGVRESDQETAWQ